MAPHDDDEFASRQSHSPGLMQMLVELGLRQASRLPESVTRLPLTGLNVAMLTAEAVRRELRDVRSHGGGVVELGVGLVNALVSLRRGVGVELKDEESIDAEAAAIARAARENSARAATEAQQATGEPGATTARTSEQAREVGAPGTATAIAEQVAEQVHGAGEVEAPERAQLPIADFDSATLGSLRARLRSLTVEQLVVLRDYERAHANRLPVVTMLENRIARVQAGAKQAQSSTTGESVRP